MLCICGGANPFLWSPCTLSLSSSSVAGIHSSCLDLANKPCMDFQKKTGKVFKGESIATGHQKGGIPTSFFVSPLGLENNSSAQHTHTKKLRSHLSHKRPAAIVLLNFSLNTWNLFFLNLSKGWICSVLQLQSSSIFPDYHFFLIGKDKDLLNL